MEHRIGDWVQTFTNKQFYPLDPLPEDVCIEDIAHALSNLCRFTGNSRNSYSVAQHSVLVASIVPDHLRLFAICHDAAEAYIGDIARPTKSSLFCSVNGSQPFIPIKKVESRIFGTIIAALGVAKITREEALIVKEADDVLLHTEARDLMPHNPDGNWWDGKLTLDQTIVPWSPFYAKKTFLEKFAEYRL